MTDAAWAELTTVGDAIVRGAALWPNADALVFPDRRSTYAELEAAARGWSGTLLGLGISWWSSA